MRLSFACSVPEHVIASYAKIPLTRDYLVDMGLSVLYFDGVRIRVLPGGPQFVADGAALRFLSRCRDYDVIEIYPDGNAYRQYRSDSDDATIVVTGRCNSNCVMCPDPDQVRRHAPIASIDTLLELVRHIPSDVPHITITGGEPFLLGEDIFLLFESLNRFASASFLLLTNGRVFALRHYLEEAKRTLPAMMTIGIPLHGFDAHSHDSVTRAPGSFIQTMKGLHGLLQLGMNVELRIVVSKLTAAYLDQMADLIVSELDGVSCVKIMGLEMLGNARINRETVWLSYPSAARAAENAIAQIVSAGIDVSLYNFPLCAVSPRFWMLCERSISDYKVRYADICKSCTVRDACGGVFAGTLRLAQGELQPVR